MNSAYLQCDSRFNRCPKEELGDSIEVIEVPRRQIDGEKVSASKVRKYYK